MVVGVLMCGLLCGTINRPATADPTQETVRSDPRSNATQVALIDMAQVFKKSRLFEQSRNALKLKVDDADVIGKRMTEELQLMIQKSKGLEQGSEERKELESQVRKKQAEFDEFRKETVAKLQKAESEIYLKIYRIASDEVAQYAQAHGIDLVIRFNEEPLVEGEDFQKLMQSLNRQVIYENRLNITHEIIAAMADR